MVELEKLKLTDPERAKVVEQAIADEPERRRVNGVLLAALGRLRTERPCDVVRVVLEQLR